MGELKMSALFIYQKKMTSENLLGHHTHAQILNSTGDGSADVNIIREPVGFIRPPPEMSDDIGG